MTEIKPVAWVDRTEDGHARMWSGDLSAWANRPANPEPLYDKATVDKLMASLRYVVRVWVVGDDAYDPEAETERAIARFMERGANARYQER